MVNNQSQINIGSDWTHRYLDHIVDDIFKLTTTPTVKHFYCVTFLILGLELIIFTNLHVPFIFTGFDKRNIKRV